MSKMSSAGGPGRKRTQVTPKRKRRRRPMAPAFAKMDRDTFARQAELYGELALLHAPKPKRSDKYYKYVNVLRTRLAEEGLPTQAPDARIALIGDSLPAWTSYPQPQLSHAHKVAHMIAGPVGLAQNAKLLLVPWAGPDLLYANGEQAALSDLSRRANAHDATLDELAALRAHGMVRLLRGTRQTIDDVVEPLTAGAELATSFINISSGVHVHHQADTLTDGVVLKAAPGSKLAADVSERLEQDMASAPPSAVKAVVAEALRGALSGEVRGTLDKAKRELRETVLEAQSEGVLVFRSAGNEQLRTAQAGRPFDDGFNLGTQGMIVVAAVKLDPSFDPTKARLSEFSSGFDHHLGYVDLAAPGEELPLEAGAKLADGTSYASPYAVTVGALMAQHNPALLPVELATLMFAPGVVTGLDSKRGGVGFLDAVAAVALSRGEVVLPAVKPPFLEVVTRFPKQRAPG